MRYEVKMTRDDRRWWQWNFFWEIIRQSLSLRVSLPSINGLCFRRITTDWQELSNFPEDARGQLLNGLSVDVTSWRPSLSKRYRRLRATASHTKRPFCIPSSLSQPPDVQLQHVKGQRQRSNEQTDSVNGTVRLCFNSKSWEFQKSFSMTLPHSG